MQEKIKGYAISDGRNHKIGNFWSKKDAEIILYRDLEKAKRIIGFSDNKNKNKKDQYENFYAYVYVLEGNINLFDQYEEYIVTNHSSQLEIVGYYTFTKEEIIKAIEAKHTVIKNTVWQRLFNIKKQGK